MVLMKKFKFLLVAAFLMLGLSANAQFYSVKTNVLGLATGNLNLELSATASRKSVVLCLTRVTKSISSRPNFH